MKRALLVTAATFLVSCAAPSGVTRVAIPPPNLPPPQDVKVQDPVLKNEEATQDFLQLQIDQSSDVKPPVEPEVQIIERIVYGDKWAGTGSHRRSSFPLRTAFGAGLGAIIGHQSGHRGGGAAIGAGVGLLLDLVAW